MDEFYSAIEERILLSGYDGPVDGEEIYNEISDEIEGKDNGTYLFFSKKENDTVFEYQVEVMDEEFNLSYIDITSGGKTFHADFDSE